MTQENGRKFRSCTKIKAESLAKIIIARKCITKTTQQISTALNRVCAKGSKNIHGGKKCYKGLQVNIL